MPKYKTKTIQIEQYKSKIVPHGKIGGYKHDLTKCQWCLEKFPDICHWLSIPPGTVMRRVERRNEQSCWFTYERGGEVTEPFWFWDKDIDDYCERIEDDTEEVVVPVEAKCFIL